MLRVRRGGAGVNDNWQYLSLATLCSCREGRSDWPLRLYHFDAPSKTCSSGQPFLAGKLCESDSECGEQRAGSCAPAFEGSASVCALPPRGMRRLAHAKWFQTRQPRGTRNEIPPWRGGR